MKCPSFYFEPRLEWLLSYPVDVVPSLAESYVVEMRNDVRALKSTNATLESRISSLHKMKGGLSMIGYHSLCDKATTLLGLLRHQPDMVTTEFDTFIAELEGSIDAIEQWFFDRTEIS